MNVQDDLKNSYSLFYAEVRRIKAIQEMVNEHRSLVLIDEMLRGTNSRERLIAEKGFLKHFRSTGSYLILATHDLELLEAEQMASDISLKHFVETIQAGKMHFDYCLREGAVGSTNALKILEMEGVQI